MQAKGLPFPSGLRSIYRSLARQSRENPKPGHSD